MTAPAQPEAVIESIDSALEERRAKKRAEMQRYRARYPEKIREIKKRYQLRQAAKLEAARTRTPVAVIEKRWGVSR